jgi:hypothetical protein
MSPKNRIVLTMRVQFHQQISEKIANAFPVVLGLKPFSLTDIYTFLRKWPAFPPDREKHVARIFGELVDRPSIREMCSNPLILAMYVAADYTAKIGRLEVRRQAPESRTEFYAAIVEELLIKRRQAQIGPVETPKKLREQREQILGELAFRHLLNPTEPANLLAWSEAVLLATRVLDVGEGDAEKYLRNLSVDTGILTEERRGETYRFLHLTFCEFFCALHAMKGKRGGWVQVLKAHSGFKIKATAGAESRLAEVVPFATGLADMKTRGRVLASVYQLNDSRSMALSFSETKAYEHDLWPSFLSREADRLRRVAASGWSESALVACTCLSSSPKTPNCTADRLYLTDCLLRSSFSRSYPIKQRTGLLFSIP